MKRRLGGGIDGGGGHWYKRQNGSVVDDRCRGLSFQMVDQSGCYSKRSDQICGYRGNELCIVLGVGSRIWQHNAGIVDEDIQCWVRRCELLGSRLDACQILQI